MESSCSNFILPLASSVNFCFMDAISSWSSYKIRRDLQQAGPCIFDKGYSAPHVLYPPSPRLHRPDRPTPFLQAALSASHRFLLTLGFVHISGPPIKKRITILLILVLRTNLTCKTAKSRLLSFRGMSFVILILTSLQPECRHDKQSIHLLDYRLSCRQR